MKQENKEIDVRAWLVRILNNWYWFALSVLVCGALGVLYYYSSTLKYNVEAEIMLRDANNGNAFMQSDMLDILGMNGEKFVDDEIAVLTSRDMFSRVIQDLNLQFEYRKKDGLRWVAQYPKADLGVVCAPEFLDTLRTTTRLDIKVRESDYVVKVQRGRSQHSKHVVKDLTKPFKTCVGEISFNVLRPDEVVKGAQYKIAIYSRSAAINVYQARISAAPVKKDSKVIAITSTTDIPSLSRDLMQGLIDLYNLDAMEDKNLMAENTAMLIDKRKRVIEDELRQAEEDKVRYLERYGLVDPEIEAELFLEDELEYRRKMVEMETQINTMNFLCEFLEDEANEDDLLPAIFMIPAYQSQSQDQYNSSNVGISSLSLISAVEDYNSLIMNKMRISGSEGQQVDQIDAELTVLRTNIVSTIKNMHNTMLIAKQDLENHFAKADQQRNKMPDHVRAYQKMEREQELKEELYLFICEQSEENALLLASTVMPIKVVMTPQINPMLVSPKYTIILLFLIVGCCLPLGFMVLYDMLNNRVTNDTKKFIKMLQVPFVGALVKNANREHITVGNGENSVSAEMFRTLRANIRFVLPQEADTSVLLVTSSVNGEGKSYVATNLAISLALLGKKVALVGLDIRKPMISTYMNLSSQGCVTSYLSDSSYELEDLIVNTSIQNLDALPAGAVPPNPSELLQSDRLDVLFEELRKRYDYVVIDSAPVAVVSDTFLLSRVADMTVYVSRVNHTTIDSIDFLNQAHLQQRLPMMVAVLNGVDAKKVGHGYYSNVRSEN